MWGRSNPFLASRNLALLQTRRELGLDMKLNKIFFILALVTFAGSVFSYDLPSRYKTFQDGDVVNQGDMNGMQDQWRNYFINEVYQGGTMIPLVTP
jgi:hypothetical protein